jgi:hypothetical protein
MPRWVVFAPWRPDDPALWNSHWVAQRTLGRVREPAHLIEREAAVRATLETALSEPTIEGVALFGHGRPHAVFGADRAEALDAANLRLVDAKWVHAFACLTGQELARSAVAADIFVGYRVALIVEWSVDELPVPLADKLAALVTSTTAALFEGERTPAELRSRAEVAAEDVAGWLFDNAPEGHMGIHILAEQLVDRMVIGGRRVVVEQVLGS